MDHLSLSRYLSFGSELERFLRPISCQVAFSLHRSMGYQRLYLLHVHLIGEILRIINEYVREGQHDVEDPEL